MNFIVENLVMMIDKNDSWAFEAMILQLAFVCQYNGFVFFSGEKSREKLNLKI